MLRPTWGPQVTKLQADKTLEYIKIAQRDGAQIVAASTLKLNSKVSSGFYVRPTALIDVPADSAALQE